MYCTNCGNEVTGNFCADCGHKVAKNSTVQENNRTKDVAHTEVEKVMVQRDDWQPSANAEIQGAPKGGLHYIKLIVMWYLCVSFLVSGVGVATSGVSIIAGVLWFVAGIILCPLSMKDKSAALKIILGVVCFFIGVGFMP